jgi:hypothetical protein
VDGIRHAFQIARFEEWMHRQRELLGRPSFGDGKLAMARK